MHVARLVGVVIGLSACGKSVGGDYCGEVGSYFQSACFRSVATDGGATVYSASACEDALTGAQCSVGDRTNLDTLGACLAGLPACLDGGLAQWAPLATTCIYGDGGTGTISAVSASCLAALKQANADDL